MYFEFLGLLNFKFLLRKDYFLSCQNIINLLPLYLKPTFLMYGLLHLCLLQILLLFLAHTYLLCTYV